MGRFVQSDDADYGRKPLFAWEKAGLIVFLVLLIAFGVIVVSRSALQTYRKTDLGVYTAAAWAVRSGDDIYQATDEHGWHYCYPPLLAIAMLPMAEPPYYELDQHSHLPFVATAIIWYLISILSVCMISHYLALAVAPDVERWSRRWWYMRTVPIYICIPAIGMTLSRGQVNCLVTLFLALAFYTNVSRRYFQAGAWLALAVAIKVIPVLMIVYAAIAWKRLAWYGYAAGLFVTLVALPAVALGWNNSIDANRQMVSAVLLPGATGQGDQTRDVELTNATATDSQSFQAVLHNWLYPDKESRPAQADIRTRLAHCVISLILLVWVFQKSRQSTSSNSEKLIHYGRFCAVMLLATPVSHMHYYHFAMPLVCGHWLHAITSRPDGIWPGWRATWPLFAWSLLVALPLFPWEWAVTLREGGAATFATVGIVMMSPREMKTAGVTHQVESEPQSPDTIRLRAAA